jgi:hypothetical protein
MTTSLLTLAADFEERESLHLPDVVVPMHDLAMAHDGSVVVPGLGNAMMTKWAATQLAHAFGYREKWFETVLPTERPVEITKRFRASGRDIKLRLGRQPGQDRPLLRAFVSRSYSPVPDSTVCVALQHSLSAVGDLPVVRSYVTDMSTTWVVQIGQPFKLGGPGNVGEVFGTLTIRNSDVGFASLLVSASLLRIACLNGLILPAADSTILLRKHRGIRAGDLPQLFADKLYGLGDRIHRGARVLEAAGEIPIADVDHEVRFALKAANLPMRLAAHVLRAFHYEPHPSRYGVSEAFTLAAQWVTAEEGLALQQAASRYLMSAGVAS